MKSALRKAWILIRVLIFASSAIANDTAIGIKGGQIEMKKTDGISMDEESLYISKDKITVDYVFRNLTNKDIQVTVGFPAFGGDGCSDIAYDDGENPINFELRVDGAEKTFKLQRPKLNDETCGGDGKYVYYWDQTFPAGKSINVHHSFRPVPSATVLESVPEKKNILVSDFCAKKTLLNKIGSSIKSVIDVSYILMTANNWDGPIKVFTLTIDKGTDVSYVFLCTDLELKKESKTIFRAKATNFVPKRDLSIAFIPGPDKQEDVSIKKTKVPAATP